ncbi:Thiamine biosynthesis protein ThiS [Acinetobacter bohemicus]|nr:Thiamine biosynthesis protein ThiS [Acinetobacter bohemicus]
MRTFLNGVAKQIIHNNLLQLIQYLPLEGKHFAVEHNQRIISKSQL